LKTGYLLKISGRRGGGGSTFAKREKKKRKKIIALRGASHDESDVKVKKTAAALKRSRMGGGKNAQKERPTNPVSQEERQNQKNPGAQAGTDVSGDSLKAKLSGQPRQASGKKKKRPPHKRVTLSFGPAVGNDKTLNKKSNRVGRGVISEKGTSSKYGLPPQVPEMKGEILGGGKDQVGKST